MGTPVRDSAHLVRLLKGIADPGLRVSYVEALALETPLEDLAGPLDDLCRGAEQAEEGPREALFAFALAFSAAALAETVQRLREEAVGRSLLALERFLREPPEPESRDEQRRERNPDYGTGRPLTLGERKSLARRPDTEMIQKILLDPHPDVIEQLLLNPALTEDLLMRLVTKRPCLPATLARVARATKWAMRPRIRLALVLNPHTPRSIASSFVGLLLRQELKLVSETGNVPESVRALCLEHLERRPPGEDDPVKILQ